MSLFWRRALPGMTRRGARRSLTRPGAFALLALIAAFAAALPTVWASRALADNRPPGGALTAPGVRAVDVAAPAVVRLATLYAGHITFAFCGRSITLPSTGPGYTLGALGSGAFVSANGDILTAAHVVQIPRASLDQELFQGQRSTQDIAIMLAANTDCLHLPFAITPDDVANGAVEALGIPFTTNYTPPTFYAWQSTSYTGSIASGSGATQSILSALLAAKSVNATPLTASAFEQDDVALLHTTLTDTPTIQLGDASAVAVQDPLTVIGFPGNGDLDPSLGGVDPTNLLTPSVNMVTVSAIKYNRNGSQLIQVGGNIEHGDSGGPAIDTAGNIVGIVSFGGPDTQGSTAFLRSSDSAKQLLTQQGISQAPGVFQKRWQQAFADYSSTATGHWHKAAQELDALNTQYPAFRGVMPFKAYADTAATQEQVADSTQAPSSTMLIALAALVLIVLITVIVVSVLMGRRRRARKRAAEAARQAAVAAAGYPQYPPQFGSPHSGYPVGGPAYWSDQAPGASTQTPIPVPDHTPPTVRQTSPHAPQG